VPHGDIQRPEQGVGPLFRRRFRARIRDAELSAEELMSAIAEDLNRVAPTKFARFSNLRGGEGRVRVGDEFLVRMPGPWNGPVRVISRTPTSFRFATLDGHLEAGQIEFRASDEDGLVFEIESWREAATGCPGCSIRTCA
jgi:hypothetical protein